MAEKILVPLKRHDRVEEVVSYIEKVTQPGTSVVFLIHHPVNSFKWLQAYCGVMGCGLERTVAIRRMVESYSVKSAGSWLNRRCFIPVRHCTSWE